MPADEDEGKAARAARIPRSRLVALIGNLRSTVKGLDWTPAGTEWADYADHTSYGDAATADKDRLVAEFVRLVPGPRAWDLGANTGRFSRIAADAGKRVLAFDIDPAAAEQHYRALQREEQDRHPAARPRRRQPESRARLGRPRAPLAARACRRGRRPRAGPVHHLAISRNVPLPMLLGLFADLAPWAIVEFVPREDPMVRRLLASRRDVFDDYTSDGFRAAAGGRFEVVREQPIAESPRTCSCCAAADRRRG